MKKLLLSAGFLICLLSLKANAQSYTFSKRADIYVPLTNGHNLTAGYKWDTNTFTVPLGFDFNFYGRIYSDIRIDSDGRIFFGPASNNVIYGYAESVDLVDRGLGSPSAPAQSPISYEVSGYWPDRIFKLEFKNVGFWPGITSDYISFQIWLYENGSHIETRYGTNAILNNNSVYAGQGGPTVGIRSFQKNVLLIGNNLNASALVNNPTFSVFMNGTPLQHTTYTFTYDGFVLGNDKADAEQGLALYPNPANDMLTISLPSATIKSVTVTDLLGKTVISKNMSTAENSTSLDISGLATGTYVVQIADGSGNQMARKITKI